MRLGHPRVDSGFRVQPHRVQRGDRVPRTDLATVHPVVAELRRVQRPVVVPDQPVRQHADPEAILHQRDLIGAHVGAQARFARACEAARDRPSTRVVLEPHSQPGASLLFHNAVLFNEPFLRYDLDDRLLEAGPGNIDPLLTGMERIADTSQEVGDRISAHSLSLPACLGHAGNLPFEGKAP